MTDWALSSANATLQMTYSSGAYAYTTTYVNDNDNATNSLCAMTPFYANGTVDYTITLQSIRSISEIKFYVKGFKAGTGSYQNATFAYYNGSWQDLATILTTGTTTWYNYTAGYGNVAKIRVICNVSDPDGANYAGGMIYTMTANGDYNDSGIRIRTSGSTISIACEALLSTHKLRFQKGNTTVGISLVPTTDILASPLRMYDGNSVKALMKYS